MKETGSTAAELEGGDCSRTEDGKHVGHPATQTEGVPRVEESEDVRGKLPSDNVVL